MAVTSISAKTGPYYADGVATVFPFGFHVESPEALTVLLAGGVAVSSTSYTVTLNSDRTGQVTFFAPPAPGAELWIVSNPRFNTQLRINDGPFLPNVIEAALDACAIRDIYLNEQCERAIKVPASEAAPSLVLPPAADRNGRFLSFDAAGRLIAASGGAGDSGLRADLAAPNGANLIGSGGLRNVTLYYDGTGDFIDRNAIFTANRTTAAPTGITPIYWSLHNGRGNNTTFIGVSGGYMKSRDLPPMTPAQRGVLYGLQLSVEPLFTRNNYPFDDAVCLVAQNEGVGKATEMIYMGRTARAFRVIGYIEAGVLHVQTVIYGVIVTGCVFADPVGGPPVGIPDTATIVGYGTGAGGVGTYTLSQSFNHGSALAPVQIDALIRDADAGIGIDCSATVAIYTTGDYDWVIDTLWGNNRSAIRKGAMRIPNNTNIIYGRNAANTLDLPILQWLNDKIVLGNNRIEQWTPWTPTITPDTGSFTTVTVNTSETKWQLINGKVTALVSFQIVNAGTGSGGIQITLPPSLPPAAAVFASGSDQNNLHALVARYDQPSQRVRFVRTGNVNPIASGTFYLLRLEYEVNL